MRATSRWLPMLLGFLTATGPLSTDMYLPAFPAIEASFGEPAGTAQITLATWFVGLAVGQIAQGTLSDRFGRRLPLLIGTVVYTLASAGCALSPDLLTLSVMRALAAFGGSASMVIPRAIVRDLADGHAAAHLMSRLMLVMGVAPILAPTLGGLVLGFGSWHLIFWICTGYGAVCSVVVWRALPDTMASHLRMRLGVAGLLSRYWGIVRERGFLTHVGMASFAMFGTFAYIGGSPPVYIQMFHLSPAHYGMIFGLCAAGFIAGSQINPRILPRFGSNRVIHGGIAVSVLATAALLVFSITRFGGIWGIVLPIFAAMTSMGFITPNAAVGALSRHPNHAGSASALMGTLQFSLAAVSGTMIGLLTDGTPRPMAAMMLAGAVGAAVCDALRPK
jgi:DHA1 family bicyclomycin/chloramphenicol resistance-like MFS transporter